MHGWCTKGAWGILLKVWHVERLSTRRLVVSLVNGVEGEVTEQIKGVRVWLVGIKLVNQVGIP